MKIIQFIGILLLTVFALSACDDSSTTNNSGSAEPTAPTTISLSGRIVLADTEEPTTANITVINQADNSTIATLSSTDQGYKLDIAESFRGKSIRIKVKQTIDGFPPVTGTLIVHIPETGDSVTLNDIALPNIGNAGMHSDTLGTFTALDGTGMKIENAPSDVASMWAKPFNPDFETEAFPGEFLDSDDDALNSSAFAWIVALDENGNELKDFSANPLTVTMPIQKDQWGDLLDLQPNNGTIEIPMYSFNEETGEWDREDSASGQLVDGNGVLIAEADGDAIRNGTHNGLVFARFTAAHLSWWNVDYAWHRDLTPPDLGVTQTFADFGDAPSNLGYPAIRHNRDRNQGNGNAGVWLGRWVSFETVQRSIDTDDDGIIECNSGEPLSFSVNNLSRSQQNRTLYLNVLIDKNKDGDWEDEGEWVAQNISKLVPFGRGGEFKTTITDWEKGQWLRATATSVPIENFTGAGVYSDGETEDFESCEKTLNTAIKGTYIPSVYMYSESPSNLIDCSNNRSQGNTCQNTIGADESVTLVLSDRDTNKNIKANWNIFSYGTGEKAACDQAQPSEKCTFLLSAISDKTVRAEASYDVYTLGTYANAGTVTSTDVPIDCGPNTTNCSYYSFTPASQITLKATPSTGYYFDRWRSYGNSIPCEDHSIDECKLKPELGKYSSVFARFLPSTKLTTEIISGTGSITAQGINCNNSASNSNFDCDEFYKPGTQVELTATAAANNSFTGWGAACASFGTANKCTVAIERTALFVNASFKTDEYPLTITPATGGSVTSPSGINCGSTCSQSLTHGTKVTLTALADTGYTFTGWTDCPTENGTSCEITMDKAYTVGASFQINRHDLEVAISGGNGKLVSTPVGIDCGIDCTETFDYGTAVTLTPTPALGYENAGWINCPSATNTGGFASCSVTMNSDFTGENKITALFNKQQFEITTQATNGTITRTPVGQACRHDQTKFNCHDYEQKLVLDALPDIGYEFTGWTGCGANTNQNPCEITVTNPQTITANFSRIQFNLTVLKPSNGSISSKPAGIDCGASCTAKFDEGNTVELTANADAGFQFSNWQNCPGTVRANVCEMPMLIDYTVDDAITAVFTQETTPTHELTVQAPSNGIITSVPSGINCGTSCSTTFAQGTSVDLIAIPNQGFKFSQWENCPGTTIGSGCSFVMNAPHTISDGITATFVVDNQTNNPKLTVTTSGAGFGTVTSSPAGIDCGIDCEETYTTNTQVTLTAEPVSGYRVADWSGECFGQVTTCILSMDTDKNIDVAFELDEPAVSGFQLQIFGPTPPQQSSVTISPTQVGKGSTCSATDPDPCTQQYAADTKVTLTANVAQGEEFSGWQLSGNPDCEALVDGKPPTTCELTMNQHRSILAGFGFTQAPE